MTTALYSVRRQGGLILTHAHNLNVHMSLTEILKLKAAATVQKLSQAFSIA